MLKTTENINIYFTLSWGEIQYSKRWALLRSERLLKYQYNWRSAGMLVEKLAGDPKGDEKVIQIKGTQSLLSINYKPDTQQWCSGEWSVARLDVLEVMRRRCAEVAAKRVEDAHKETRGENHSSVFYGTCHPFKLHFYLILAKFMPGC